MPSLAILFPAYNEAAKIGEIVRRVRAVPLQGVDVTVLVVNDGSADNTAEVAAAAGAVVLSHPQNRGVGAAFRTGRDWAMAHGADYLVHLDADGQLLPEEIPLLFEPVLQGAADLSLGTRFKDRRRPEHLRPWKATALHSFARLIGLLTGYALSDISCGFRCMNRRVLGVMQPSFDYDYIQECLLQALALRVRVVEVPVTAIYPPAHGPGTTSMSSRVMAYGSRFVGLSAYALANFYRVRVVSLLSSPPQKRA